MSKLKEWMTWPIAAVLIAGGLLFAAIVIFAPADARAELLGANGLLWTLVASYLRSPRETPPAPPPPVLVLLLAASLTAGMASGCGVSAVQTSARAATVAAGITQGAARVVTTGSNADFQATCPRAQYPDQASATACAVPVRARWAPADAAIGSTRAALVAWVEMTNVAHLAGDDGSLWAPLALAAARLVAEYDALRAVLAPLDVDLPAMPSIVADLANAIGGQ